MRPVINKLFIGQRLYHINPHDKNISEGRIVTILLPGTIGISWYGRVTYHYGLNDEIWNDIVMCCTEMEPE